MDCNHDKQTVEFDSTVAYICRTCTAGVLSLMGTEVEKKLSTHDAMLFCAILNHVSSFEKEAANV